MFPCAIQAVIEGYEKLSASVSGSGGVGGFSGNLSLSQTTMDSNWASVTDQSGIYAGSGGYDITVGNNTDLKGAVIALSAENKANNKLDTGTISFSDMKTKRIMMLVISPLILVRVAACH